MRVCNKRRRAKIIFEDGGLGYSPPSKNSPPEYFPSFGLRVYDGVNDGSANNPPLPMSACLVTDEPALLF